MSFFFLSLSRGTTSNEEHLLPRWNECSEAIKSSTGSVVLHLGKLPIGLCKHRTLLFKVCFAVYIKSLFLLSVLSESVITVITSMKMSAKNPLIFTQNISEQLWCLT
jgi:hypothetical protein